MRAILDEIVLAFTTASSEVTLPRLMKKTHEMGVSKGITAFVIPTGYTFNLDGSAIYQSLAAIFLAQAYGLHLSLSHQSHIRGRFYLHQQPSCQHHMK